MQLARAHQRDIASTTRASTVNTLAAGQLEPRLTNTLLYGLQMASNNLLSIPLCVSLRSVVRSVDTTPDGHGLAKNPTFYNDGKSEPK